MERVTGIGGVFMRPSDPDALSRRSAEHLEGNRFELWEPAPETHKRP